MSASLVVSGVARVVLEEPRRRLAVPDEHVAVDAQVVLGRVCHQRIGVGVRAEVALASSYQASGFMWFSGVIWSK